MSCKGVPPALIVCRCSARSRSFVRWGRCILTAPALRRVWPGWRNGGLCGREPGPVAVGERVVASESALDGGDVRGPDAEVVGDGGQGEVFGLSSGSEVVPLRDRAGLGEVAVDLADDGAFELSQDLLLRPASVELVG